MYLLVGGSSCYIPSLNKTNQPVITHLILRRLSARNCQIKEIDRQFLKSFRPTLKKLDLSCNHLRPFLEEITNGVAFSPLTTLLLDHINNEGQGCIWKETQNIEMEMLQNTPLEILSVQANQLGIESQLNLREYCSNLIYLDVSQNNFGGIAFYIVRTIRGQSKPEADRQLFQNKNLQSPSIRYIGLQKLTNSLRCGEYDERILNCNEDSYLFLEDEFYWNYNYNPNILDFQLLYDIVRQYGNWFVICMFRECSAAELVNIMNVIVFNYMDIKYVSHSAINQTVQYLLQEAGSSMRILNYMNDIRYFLVNATTLALGYNNFVSDSDAPPNAVCSYLQMYPNNVNTLDFSHSTIGFGACTELKGFTYLSNISFRECGTHDWEKNLFSNFPLRYLDFTKNYLGPLFRNDMTGEALRSAPGLETLLLGEQLEQGIQYFQNVAILSNHPNLTHLDLHSNKLISWNISIVDNTKLSTLDLRDNRISYIDKRFRDELDNQHDRNSLVVHLAGNSVPCYGESHLDYISWLLNSPAVEDAEELKCSGSDITIEEYYKNELQPTTVHSSPDVAPQQIQTATIVVTTTITLAVIIMFVIGWINRYTILYRLYRLRQKELPYRNDGKELTKEVFASYTQQFTDSVVCKYTTSIVIRHLRYCLTRFMIRVICSASIGWISHQV